MANVFIPALGVSVQEATITEWHVADGDVVTEGQLLYTVATDKAETDVESPAGGTVRLVGTEGETYPVGALIAEIS